MQQPAAPKPARTVRTEGLALRFVPLLGDPRVTCAVSASCLGDSIDVRYLEAHVVCHLVRTVPGRLRCTFTARHLAPDGTTAELHHWDLGLGGPPGSLHQREAVLRHLHAFHCAAAAGRFRTANRVIRAPGRRLAVLRGSLAA